MARSLLLARSLAVILLGGLQLSACAGRLNGGLLPMSETVPGAHTVDILVATTRRPSEAPEKMFSGERDNDLHIADVTVSVPPDANRVIGEVQSPGDTSGDPATQFVALATHIPEQADAARYFHAKLAQAKKRRVLVFVHGFNTRFSEAVFRLAQFAHDSDLQASPILFTWPSRGQLLAYTYDRESANYSRDALELLLAGLQKDPAIEEIDILAHSMGNWVTIEALRQMAIRDKRLAPKIKQVMLASPDVDVDVFRRQIIMIGPNRPPFTVFVSRDDEALKLSKRIWGDKPRLGGIDPEVEPYATMFRDEKILAVDLTDIKTPDKLGHSKFAESPEVVRSIGMRLAGGQAFAEKPGLGATLAQTTTGAAATIGSAASLVVSAPLAIVDGRTREGLDDQFHGFSDNLTNTLDGGY